MYAISARRKYAFSGCEASDKLRLLSPAVGKTSGRREDSSVRQYVVGLRLREDRRRRIHVGMAAPWHLFGFAYSAPGDLVAVLAPPLKINPMSRRRNWIVWCCWGNPLVRKGVRLSRIEGFSFTVYREGGAKFGWCAIGPAANMGWTRRCETCR